MQNRYAGDIGDFGKIGLLRTLQKAGFSIGVNWYLTLDESHNSDGRYTQYLEKDLYRSCDAELWDSLKKIVVSGKRSVPSIQKTGILKATYYDELLDFSAKTKSERETYRAEWHKAAHNLLSDFDIVFADPDNGLLVPSAVGTAKENKYVKPQELLDYYCQGSSVVYYQHKARRRDSFYSDQHEGLLKYFGLPATAGFGLKFRTTSQRYYFFILQPRHKDQIQKAVDRLLDSSWREHFQILNL